MGLALLNGTLGQEQLDRLQALLREKTRTGYDILDAFPEDADIPRILLLLKTLWKHGLIDQAAL